MLKPVLWITFSAQKQHDFFGCNFTIKYSFSAMVLRFAETKKQHKAEQQLSLKGNDQAC